MMWEKLRVVSDEAVKEASEDYRDTFGEDAIAENVAKRFHEIVPPRWLIATMQFPRPEAGEVSKVFFLSALLTSELEPSRWRRSGVNFAKPFMFYLLRGRRREQMDAVRHDNAPKASVAVQLITPKAEDAWRGLNGPLRRPLFAVHGIYAQWHFYASYCTEETSSPLTSLSQNLTAPPAGTFGVRGFRKGIQETFGARSCGPYLVAYNEQD